MRNSISYYHSLCFRQAWVVFLRAQTHFNQLCSPDAQRCSVATVDIWKPTFSLQQILQGESKFFHATYDEVDSHWPNLV